LQRERTKSAPRTRATVASPALLARRYETVALVLQGGGALGAYQCGVYEALHRADIAPTWFAGTSIGAINAAILAGNASERRIERLHEFWTTISEPAGPFAWQPAIAVRDALAWLPPNGILSGWIGALSAFGALAQGQAGFFVPRAVSPFGQPPGSAGATSFYDTAPLRETLERLVDFDRINADRVRLTIGATHVASGNFRYFDSARERIEPEHVMASGALPPAFPAIEIDGELYWDGGLVSNTPLEYVLESSPRRDTLAFEVDLWSARGIVPRTLLDVLERQKDIQYSSRTRMTTDAIAARQRLRNALSLLLEEIPRSRVPPRLVADLEPWLCDRVFNIIHLIYRAKPYEEQFKDYAFGPGAMREHWKQGDEDMARTLARPEFFEPPPRETGVVTHDIHRLDERPDPT
ncbi:MAG TPA: patatin-like phospholipase family protein, partial [Rhodanobacteraceae bacterium]|nr:patatin-like phospholipase family protein [Rhodanobacteraceae bacterium]